LLDESKLMSEIIVDDITYGLEVSEVVLLIK
jgi:hypothetical protein